MKRKISLKSCLLLCICCVICSSIIPIYGSGTVKEIMAYLNYNLNIIKDNEIIEMKDANNERVYPITYNGTTYVPIRAMGNLFGASVEWEGATNSVVLKSDDIKKGKNLLEDINYSTTLNTKLSNEDCKITLSSGETKLYDNGLSCSLISNQDFQLSNYIGLNVKDINTVTFVGYSEFKTNINVFNQQGKLIKTFYLNPDTITSFELDFEKDKATSIYFIGVSQVSMQKSGIVKLLNIYGK